MSDKINERSVVELEDHQLDLVSGGNTIAGMGSDVEYSPPPPPPPRQIRTGPLPPSGD